MNPITLCDEIEQRYRRYLETTFYFKDPILRKSFKDALARGYLSKGPFIEATLVFKKGVKTGELLKELITDSPDAGFLKALQGERPLYLHQETAIRKVIKDNHNIVVTTGTASGKTEAFLYSILTHLYREFKDGILGPGVRALILYPMNALANDQRDRLGKICQQLAESDSKFNFTYGQYIGATPEDENDRNRNAQDILNHRLPGELVLRKEMRESPPHILLTNYSMLEYLLIRPDDSPLFDNGNAEWWRFIVLDEAHQYRGARGIEMGMLIRRLKRRLIEGGRSQPFSCIATSATIAGSERDKSTVAKFASELFGEPFESEDIVFGEQEAIISNRDEIELAAKEYIKLGEAMSQKSIDIMKDVANHHNIKISKTYDLQTALGVILQNDSRSTKLRQSLDTAPRLASEFSRELFPELENHKSVETFTKLIELLLNSKCPITETPLINARCHLFLRSLEGAFISFIPEKCIYLEKAGSNANKALFEVALCRECGQHYLVGRLTGGKLCEAIRDPGHPEFGATFFRPVNENEYEEPEEGNDDHELYELCISCGAIVKKGDESNCEHSNSIVVEQQKGTEEREDQIPKCSACGYSAPDPVREVVHGADGPHAVIATTLVQKLPKDRKKVLALLIAGRKRRSSPGIWRIHTKISSVAILYIKSLAVSRTFHRKG